MTEATSPTDRIEQLLNKYKARYNLSSAASGSSESSTPAYTPCKHEAFSWHDINKQLRARGFVEVMFTSAGKPEENGAAVMMDKVSVQSIKTTIMSLLEDFDRKQNLIQQLLNDSNKESEQLKLMREETGQSRNQVNNLEKQLTTQAAKYKELEEVHFLSLKDHAQQMDDLKKDQTRAVTTCQELQSKCVNQEAEINHLKNQLATLKFNLDAHMSESVSVSACSQHSSPMKKPPVVPPYHDQQLENDFQLLQTQINNLKYKNIKLQLDLQNRPERQELRQAQKQVKQLQQELIQCKKLLSSEQREMHHAQRHLESICVLLNVKDMDHVIPCLQQHQVMLKAMKDMEKCLVAVVDLLAHPNSPGVQHSPTPRRGHMSWCHYSWDHVIPTLKQWLKELNGLKELYAVFADVCNSLKLKGPKHDISETFEYSTLSCKQMSVLLRQWLLKDHNRKVAQQQALVTMVTHYQRMFGVKWVGGVYASMSHVAMTLEESQNILKTIKETLHLDHSSSGRQVVAMVEQLASNHDDTSLMAQIVKQVGLTTPSEVVEWLKLCQRFFPAFQQVISEVQELLGVHSLGAISPALQELQRKTMK